MAATNDLSAEQSRRVAVFQSRAANEPEPNGDRGGVGPDDRSLDGTRVLVVDDDFRNVFALTALLERAHGAVTAAESGPDGITALERNPDIDLVLMDIMMPGMDGYTAIRAIRAREQFKSIPIIAVTGKVVAGERQRCLDAGANDYVPKPVNTADLLDAIVPWLPGVARSET
jgi:CheY-like chemotaxis protein